MMQKITNTHSYAILEVSEQTYNEIKLRLEKANYQHTFLENTLIDMHGIALRIEKEII